MNSNRAASTTSTSTSTTTEIRRIRKYPNTTCPGLRLALLYRERQHSNLNRIVILHTSFLLLRSNICKSTTLTNTSQQINIQPCRTALYTKVKATSWPRTVSCADDWTSILSWRTVLTRTQLQQSETSEDPVQIKERGSPATRTSASQRQITERTSRERWEGNNTKT